MLCRSSFFSDKFWTGKCVWLTSFGQVTISYWQAMGNSSLLIKLMSKVFSLEKTIGLTLFWKGGEEVGQTLSFNYRTFVKFIRRISTCYKAYNCLKCLRWWVDNKVNLVFCCGPRLGLKTEGLAHAEQYDLFINLVQFNWSKAKHGLSWAWSSSSPACFKFYVLSSRSQ